MFLCLGWFLMAGIAYSFARVKENAPHRKLKLVVLRPVFLTIDCFLPFCTVFAFALGFLFITRDTVHGATLQMSATCWFVNP